ncbi:MAG: hypothetical protein WAO98_10065 [Alphaproteobacteria bacterium]
MIRVDFKLFGLQLTFRICPKDMPAQQAKYEILKQTIRAHHDNFPENPVFEGDPEHNTMTVPIPLFSGVLKTYHVAAILAASSDSIASLYGQTEYNGNTVGIKDFIDRFMTENKVANNFVTLEPEILEKLQIIHDELQVPVFYFRLPFDLMCITVRPNSYKAQPAQKLQA